MAFRKPPQYETKLCPAGLHAARCIGVIDLGLQKTEWNNEVSEKQQIRLFWEFTKCQREWEKDGIMYQGPHILSKSFNYLFADNASLTKCLESWRGKELTYEEKDTFDLHSVLGKPCTINVLHAAKQNGSGDTAKIEAVMPLMEEHKDIPDAISPLMYYNMPEHGENIPNELPQWTKETIRSSKEYQTYAPEKGPQDKAWDQDDQEQNRQDIDDDIPF